jgi:molybdenum cofactor synthesis domain-containing protein
VRRERGAVTDGLTVRVVTVSTRAAAGEYADRSGPRAVEALRALGHEVIDAVVVADGEPFADVLSSLLGDAPDVIVTAGGTGLAADDVTPEITRRFIDREVPGVSEALRQDGRQRGIAMAAMSRGVCGVAGRTLVVNLPGSVGGVSDGIEVLAPLLVHAVEQIAGGDH